MRTQILCIAGPTASGKSSLAIEEAKVRDGEIISVDSRQVYRGLDIGTEKVPVTERHNIPHHLIDIRDVSEPYSAYDFVVDAKRLIVDIRSREKLPILVGGTHFYFDALLSELPKTKIDPTLRAEFEVLSAEELYARIQTADPRRAEALDPKNKRRLIRALEIIATHGHVPERSQKSDVFDVEWIVLQSSPQELRERIEKRLQEAFERGLIEEVRTVREQVGDERLQELGLEYRIVGEYLRGERAKESLMPTLLAKLWQYARRQNAWLRKLDLLNTNLTQATQRRH